MPVAGQQPTRIHLIDSESVTWEQIGAAYPDPNDPTYLVRDVKAHAASTLVAIPSTMRGNFTLAHGLGRVPDSVVVNMTTAGIIRFQPSPSPPWDATNVYLNASADGLTGFLSIT